MRSSLAYFWRGSCAEFASTLRECPWRGPRIFGALYIVWDMATRDVSFSFFFASSSSWTYYFSFLITFWQKCDLFANSFSTSLCICMSLCRVSIFCFILLFFSRSCSVYLLWYSSSVVSWWFWSIVSLVVVWSCSSLSAKRLALVSFILKSISFRSFSVAWIFCLSFSPSSNCWSLIFWSRVYSSWVSFSLYCACFSS